MGNLINDLDNNLVDEQYSNLTKVLTKVSGHSASATPLTPPPPFVDESGNATPPNNNQTYDPAHYGTFNPTVSPTGTPTISPTANQTVSPTKNEPLSPTSNETNDEGTFGGDSGGTIGGGSGGGSAPQEEATEGGGGTLRVADKKILGLSPKMFYGILAVATLVGGYYAFKYKVIKL